MTKATTSRALAVTPRMEEAKVGFRRLKSHRQLPAFRRALVEHHALHALKNA